MKRKLIVGLMALLFVASPGFAAFRAAVIIGPRYVPVAPVYVAPPVVPVPAPVVVAPPFVRAVWIPGHWAYGPHGRYWIAGYWRR